jgi:hypothetical protein
LRFSGWDADQYPSMKASALSRKKQTKNQKR